MKTLKFTNSEKLFFTSDLHLGHEGIIHHCNRPFSSVEEMDEMIIYNWNRTISKEDIVFILGDFCWRTGNVEKYIKQLTGTKILVLGNHDLSKKYPGMILHDGYVNIRVIDPDGVDGRESGYQRLTLCHYPMLSWYQSHRGAWQLFGHWHNATVKSESNIEEVTEYVKEEHLYMDRTRWNQYDVGVDGNNFVPIPYHEIKRIINERKK